jgi:hypothetical protein
MLIAVFASSRFSGAGFRGVKVWPSESGTPLALGPKGMESGGLTKTKPSAAPNALIVEVAKYGHNGDIA